MGSSYELISFKDSCPDILLPASDDAESMAAKDCTVYQEAVAPAGSERPDGYQTHITSFPSHAPDMVYQEAASTKRRKTVRANIRRQKAAEKESCCQTEVAERLRANIITTVTEWEAGMSDLQRRERTDYEIMKLWGNAIRRGGTPTEILNNILSLSEDEGN